jgi:hypothetical protein
VESCRGWPSPTIEGGWGRGDSGPAIDGDEAAGETRGDGLPEVEAEGGGDGRLGGGFKSETKERRRVATCRVLGRSIL